MSEIEIPKQTTDLKNLFVATASHQLRTPLSVIKWVMSVLVTDPDLQKKESVMQLVKQASTGVDRMVDTVNDLINVVRIDEGRLPVTLMEGDISSSITKVVNAMKPIAESHDITLAFNTESEVPAFPFDQILMTEAVENLVTNAIDYNNSKDGSVTIDLKKDGDTVEIKVSSTGPGFSKADSEHLFEPFYRGDSALQLRPDGSGLGLYICKAIMDAHKGEITVESEKNTTVVRLRIPSK